MARSVIARAAVTLAAAAGLLVAGTGTATAEQTRVGWDCGLNTWTTWEPYYGTLIHYAYKNCESSTVYRRLHSVMYPERPYPCWTIEPGRVVNMGYASTAGWPPEDAVAC